MLLFFGIGGPLAAKAGLRVLYPCDKIAVIGITAVFRQFRAIYQAMRICKQALQQEKPDALVLIDYPGFNIRLARYAKRCGIPVWYYISPKIWVWKANRIHTLAATVSHMAVIFPFEVPLYEQVNLPVTLVAHPSVTQVKTTLGPGIIRQNLDIPQHAGLITLMPGSRFGEVKAHLPILCAAAEKNTRASRLLFYYSSCHDHPYGSSKGGYTSLTIALHSPYQKQYLRYDCRQ